MRTSEPPRRRASRGLVVDARGRVILFRAELPGQVPWWFAPGGGLEEGETHAGALVRELAEEIGLTIGLSDVGAPVWTRDHLFIWHGTLERHLEQFYLVRVPFHAVDTSGILGDEGTIIRGCRWWSVEEMETSGEHFAPRRIAELLAPLIRGELPRDPVDAGD